MYVSGVSIFPFSKIWILEMCFLFLFFTLYRDGLFYWWMLTGEPWDNQWLAPRPWQTWSN